MTTKLIYANMGMKLVLDVDGQERTVEFSAVCPSESHKQPASALREMVQFFNEIFETELYITCDSYKREASNVELAKPRKIKAPKRVSQDEYNRRIKELQP